MARFQNFIIPCTYIYICERYYLLDDSNDDTIDLPTGKITNRKLNTCIIGKRFIIMTFFFSVINSNASQSRTLRAFVFYIYLLSPDYHQTLIKREDDYREC